MKKQLTESDIMRDQINVTVPKKTKTTKHTKSRKNQRTPDKPALDPIDAFTIWLSQDHRKERLIVSALARAFDAGVSCGKALAATNKSRRI